MKKTYGILFFGCLAVLTGIGDDKSEIIPSGVKISIGFLAIGYGTYLMYNTKEKTFKSEFIKNENLERKKTRPSYFYLTIGVLLMSLTKYLIRKNDYIMSFWIIVVGICGFAISIYGLIIFFREKREKKDSGSIE